MDVIQVHDLLNINEDNEILSLLKNEKVYYSDVITKINHYGLNPDDILLRGYIDVNGNGQCNYHHGWVEFTFDGKEYVFDNDEIAKYTESNFSQTVINEKTVKVYDSAIENHKKKVIDRDEK